ncbi:hypothetical protein, partial [Bacteroides heparinolyticus]|uniref:hypothetical protein n=1 Tax=Prevotella heparinolytica TaxID=28113 RepID=UPI00359FC4C7
LSSGKSFIEHEVTAGTTGDEAEVLKVFSIRVAIDSELVSENRQRCEYKRKSQYNGTGASFGF